MSGPSQPVVAPEEVPQTNGNSPPKPTILLIHGLWMTGLCWEDWITFFASHGYTAIAPSWPGFGDRTPAEIRADPKALEGLTIHAVVDHYVKIIESLPSPPIIIGHSFGGLFVQILLSRGYGVAGVGVSPAQPSGVLALKLSTVKAGFGVLGNPFTYNKAVPFSESQFHYAFGNALGKAESKVLWEKYSVPAAAHILWQGALGVLGGGDGVVDWKKADRAPLLLIAGTNDHVVPKEIVEAEKKKYVGKAVVELKIFEGRTHGIVNQEGWEEVAGFALEWVKEKAKV
ncbi:alpha/beta-hydrolase [Stipitochalara longipes BDJ]|nr:alpha/beta-hydrolase [Stipitochalara longipes BDJ]